MEKELNQGEEGLAGRGNKNKDAESYQVDFQREGTMAKKIHSLSWQASAQGSLSLIRGH